MKRLSSLLLIFCLTLSGAALFGAPAGGLLLAAAPVATTDVDAIAKWAGLYQRSMIAQMLNGLDVFTDLSPDRNVSRHGKLLPKFTVENGLRPLDTSISRNNRKERSLSGRTLYVRDCMKLYYIVPEDLRESFLGDMLAPGAPDMPFAQWFWQREMEKLASEINDNFYSAEYHDGAPDFDSGVAYQPDDIVVFGDTRDFYKMIDGSATTTGQSPTTHPGKWTLVNQTVCFDGPGTIIAKEITASNITPITTGAITNSNALDKVDVMYDSMPSVVRNKRGTFHVSYDVFRDYIKHEQSVFGNTVTPDSGDGAKYIYGSGKRWQVKPASWMGASSRIIVNVENNNLIPGTTINSPNVGLNKFVQTLHGYEAVSKFLLGFEIADLDVLFVNDQV